MQGRQLTILAAIAAVAILAAIWASRERVPDASSSVGGRLVPGLEEDVNDVTKVEIGAGEGPLVTIERTDDAWVIAEKSGYPADVNKLRETLLGLSIAEVLEEKTSDPENYAQLGVTDVIAEEEPGAHLTITGLGEPVELVIGQTARGGSSTYARRAGEATALLVSGNLDIDRQPVDWLHRDVLDVTGDTVQSVSIVHPEGRNVEIAKESRDLPDFTVAEIPEGQKLVSAAETNSLASALTGLRLEDVEPEEAFEPEESIRSTYRLFDGKVFTVYAFEIDERKLIHVQADFDADLAERFAVAEEDEAAAAADETLAGDAAGTGETAAPAEDEAIEPEAAPEDAAEATSAAEEEAPAEADDETSDAEESAAGAAEKLRIAMDAAREEAEMLDARLEPWIFEITDYKYEQLTRAPDDIFEPTVPEGEAEGS
ncbi:MAG: DUF4340 domain-containing protein [Gammaproteobacteria bacterium]